MSEIIQPPQESQHKLIALMDRMHAANVFRTPEQSKAFLDGMDFEQFEGLLNRINGICRDIGTGDRRLDGSGIIEMSNATLGWSVPEYIPPAVEDRRALMQNAFEAAKKIPDPERAATMLGLSINIIHPFNDGNGRTSRYVYSLLTHGYDGSQEDQSWYERLLANTEGRKLVNLDPSKEHLAARFNFYKRQRLAEEYGYNGDIPTYCYGGYDAVFVEDEKPHVLLTNETITEQNRNMLHLVIKDGSFAASVFIEHLLANGKDVSPFVRVHDEGKRKLILLEEIVPTLTNKDIEDLASRQQKIKKEYAEDVINIFVDTENEQFARQVTERYRPKSAE